ncbi:phage baseplate protein [Streptomyces sp. NBC_01477]|uniref:phage baseplate protein n=1 Tax=Streptomyces sp. NBC_01477 TaxID=2976015 RepID=UPI002E3470C8|nr:teichoic acid biosynthesis protein C [Streptomyces sp. NBC_01477]
MTTSQAGRPGVSRRTLLRSSVAVAAAAATVGTPVSAAAGGTGAVADGERFDLTQPSYDLFRNVALHSATVLQGFAFNDVNGRLFTIQLTSGTGSTSGDLTVTQLSLTGQQSGSMTLTGFGHGVSIAAQPVGSDTYLWTEKDANTNGYGAHLTRFRFVNGSTLDHGAASLPTYTPVAGGLEFTCSIDAQHDRMAVRYHTPAGKRIALFPLADATAGTFSNTILDIAQPDELASVTIQGYTLYGNYLYTLDGTAYSAANPDPGNTYVRAVDLGTGEVVQRFLTTAGGSLTYREPEGMTVSVIQGEPRLYFGFASQTGSPRLANIFYKKAWI